jgi:exocyst complex component 1
MLAQESLEKTQSIERIEGAVAELYKALQAGRDRGEKYNLANKAEY